MPPELRENRFLFFEATQSVVLCYGSPSKVIQKKRKKGRQGGREKKEKKKKKKVGEGERVGRREKRGKRPLEMAQTSNLLPGTETGCATGGYRVNLGITQPQVPTSIR